MTDFGYCRVSSAEQSVGGLSIDVQIDRLKALGIDRKNIFVDAGKSGGVKEENVEYKYNQRHFITIIDLNTRPALQELMSKLKEGDVIHCTRFDRVSRNIHFLECFINWCERKGVTLQPIDDSTHRLTRRILTVIAQEELEKTMIRNDDVFKQIYERGGWAYKPPYGYIKNIKNPDGGLKYPYLPESALLIDTEQAWTVKTIFEWIALDQNPKDIAKRLKISPATIYDITKNRVYCGFTHYKGEFKKSTLVPIIISEELYEKANSKIKRKK